MSNLDGSYVNYAESVPVLVKKDTDLVSPYLFSGQTPRYKITTIVNALGTVLRLVYGGTYPDRYSLLLDVLASGHTPAQPEDVLFMRLTAEFFLDLDRLGKDFPAPVGPGSFRVDQGSEMDQGVIWLTYNYETDDFSGTDDFSAERVTARFRMTPEVYADLIAAGLAALGEMADHEVGPMARIG